MRRLVSPTGKRQILDATHPNLGVAQAYYRRLMVLIDAMHRNVTYTIRVAYRRNPPENMATDRSPAAELEKAMKRLVARWTARFSSVAKAIAKRFAKQAEGRASAGLQASMSKAGLSIQWKLTPAANDAVQASIAENVALIKSIPSEYLTQVQGHVMRSVAAGGDLEALTKALTAQFGVTRRRAELIATDQNRKLTAVVQKTRMQEAGITQAIWVHSAGGKHPRPLHVKAGKERLIYNVAEGALIDGKRIWPGTEINCRCVARPVVPGFS
jgi:uncharacterized protein with gpF-like domain